MEFEIKVTGPRACGKTYAIELIRKQLEHHIGHIGWVEIFEDGDTEVHKFKVHK